MEMEPCTLAFKLDRDRVRLLLTMGDDELLRASLPTPATFWSGKPAKALLESLSIWLDTSLRVVLSADEPAAGFSLALTDELGTGLRTVFYEVVVAERAPRRRVRLGGPGSAAEFRDVRQLCLLDRRGGGR
jgi:hypothetical protein